MLPEEPNIILGRFRRSLSHPLLFGRDSIRARRIQFRRGHNHRGDQRQPGGLVLHERPPVHFFDVPGGRAHQIAREVDFRIIGQGGIIPSHHSRQSPGNLGRLAPSSRMQSRSLATVTGLLSVAFAPSRLAPRALLSQTLLRLR